MKRIMVMLLVATLTLGVCTSCGSKKNEKEETVETATDTATDTTVDTQTDTETDTDAATEIDTAADDSTTDAQTAQVDKDSLNKVLVEATGWAGTAGSSLKCAIVATQLAQWSIDNNASELDSTQLAQAAKEWYDAQTEENQADFQEGIQSAIDETDAMFTNFDAVSGQFEDAGAKEDAQNIIATEGAQDDWNAFSKALTPLAPAE